MVLGGGRRSEGILVGADKTCAAPIEHRLSRHIAGTIILFFDSMIVARIIRSQNLILSVCSSCPVFQ